MPFSICFLLFLYYSLFSHLFVLIGNPIWQGIVQVQSILFISLPLHMNQAARRDDIAACFTERTHLGFDAHFLEAGSRWTNAKDPYRQFITEQCPPTHGSPNGYLCRSPRRSSGDSLPSGAIFPTGHLPFRTSRSVPARRTGKNERNRSLRNFRVPHNGFQHLLSLCRFNNTSQNGKYLAVYRIFFNAGPILNQCCALILLEAMGTDCIRKCSCPLPVLRSGIGSACKFSQLSSFLQAIQVK